MLEASVNCTYFSRTCYRNTRKCRLVVQIICRPLNWLFPHLFTAPFAQCAVTHFTGMHEDKCRIQIKASQRFRTSGAKIFMSLKDTLTRRETGGQEVKSLMFWFWGGFRMHTCSFHSTLYGDTLFFCSKPNAKHRHMGNLGPSCHSRISYKACAHSSTKWWNCFYYCRSFWY